MGTKLTPKVDMLMRSEHIGKVNEMLDSGISPSSVHKYLESVGFEISRPTVYKYSKMRKEGLLDECAATTGELITDPAHDPGGIAQRRLLTEIQALDALIEKGYQAVLDMDPKDVPPKLLLDAIRAKNELTGGAHATLTQYGYASLKQLDDQRWHMVMQFMMTFISDGQKEEVRRGVEEIEERIFNGTPWQDEYIQAKKLAEANSGKCTD